MLGRFAGLLVLVVGLSAPAFAQTVGDRCKELTQEFRLAGVPVAQMASDVAGALAARAELAPKEAAAREKCAPGGLYWTTPIDVSKEDLDIALARHVPACKAFIEQASPIVSTAPQGRGDPQKSKVLAETLAGIRGEAETPCKDYPGVMGRMYRAQLLLESFVPPPAQGGKPS